jgi:IS30 family transposase
LAECAADPALRYAEGLPHMIDAYRPVYAEGSYRFRRQRQAILDEDTVLKRFVLDRLA